MVSSVTVGCGTCDCVLGWSRWLAPSLLAVVLVTVWGWGRWLVGYVIGGCGIYDCVGVGYVVSSVFAGCNTRGCAA